MLNNRNKGPNLGDLLLLLRRNILESIKKEDIKQDLTFSQLEVLHFVGISGEKTMKCISDYLKITPPSVTELIREMEKKNLVKRIIGKKDRRIVSVVLTNTAKRNYISISKNKEEILNRMVSKLNKEDKKTLERIIKIITTK
jgi:DNA-binding MarR family transcriptional regulator